MTTLIGVLIQPYDARGPAADHRLVGVRRLSPFMSRLIFVLLIARAVLAPVSLRNQLADRAAAGFSLPFPCTAAAFVPEALPAQLDDGRPDDGLVIRVCHWPVPRSRHASSELARRVAKPRITSSRPAPVRDAGPLQARVPR